MSKTWIEATVELMLRFDLGEHSISVPFNPTIVLVTAKADTKGRVPMAEFLVILNMMPVGGYDSIGILYNISAVLKTVLDPTLISFSIKGIVTFHLTVGVFAVHLNNSSSPGQMVTVSWGKCREIILSVNYEIIHNYERMHWP